MLGSGARGARKVVCRHGQNIKKQMDTLSYKTVSANKATAQKEWVVIDATDDYMILKPENVKFEKYEVVGCDTCLGEYIPKEIRKYITVEKEGKQPFATGAWLLENQRLPNSNNFRYFGFNDEMPIAGLVYTQYTFDYVSDRPGLGGHSGVGQDITAITNHTFFVEQNAAPEFEKVFAGKTFENTAE